MPKQLPKPKFEKVDAHTIRITVEKANDVPLAQLLDNKEQLLEQKMMQMSLKRNVIVKLGF